MRTRSPAAAPDVPGGGMPADDGDQDAALDAFVAAIEAGRAEIPPDDEDDWEDPDCSCPREYVGVPLREVLAEAGAREAEQAPAAPEAREAGFLPRGIPAAHPSPGPAGGVTSGGVLDAALPDPVLGAFAEEVTGPDGRCTGTTDDELIGVLCAWQRQESRAAARKLAVIAELIRRRPAPGSESPGPGAMRRSPLPSSSPRQASPRLAPRPAPARLPHLDAPRRPHLHGRPRHLPDLTKQHQLPVPTKRPENHVTIWPKNPV